MTENKGKHRRTSSVSSISSMDTPDVLDFNQIEAFMRENGCSFKEEEDSMNDKVDVNAKPTLKVKSDTTNGASKASKANNGYSNAAVRPHTPQKLRKVSDAGRRISLLAKRQVYSVRNLLTGMSTFKTTKSAALKIETLSPYQITRFYFGLYSCISISILCTVLLVAIMNYADNMGETEFIRKIQKIEAYTDTALRIFIAILSTIFIRRIYIHKARMSVQAAIAFISGVYGIISVIGAWIDDGTACHSGNHIVKSVLNSVESALIYGVLIHISRCYRYSAEQSEFVTPNIVIFFILIAAYITTRVVLSTLVADIILDYIPLSNMATAWRMYLEGYKHQPNLFWVCAVISFLDLCFLSSAFYEVRLAKSSFSKRFVQDVRGLYLGFNFFMFQNALMVMMLVFGGQLTAWMLPLSFIYDTEHNMLPCAGLPMGTIGFRLSITMWLFSAMYLGLPVNSCGIAGWFCDTAGTIDKSSSKSINQHIQYFAREADVFLKANFSDLLNRIGTVNPQHFILETHVEMFNFAYLAYACGHKSYGQEFADFEHMIGNPIYSLVDHIHNAETNTHCLIFQSQNRIVVAFKGTSSIQNAKTDINLVRTRHPTADLVQHATPKDFSPTSISRPNCWKSSKPWVHKGFWTAYSSVSQQVLTTIQALNEDQPRVVAVTGHSLGGALATLCSFDVATTLNCSDVFCTTFGSPRVGGNAFKRCYNARVPATFRLVNSSDVFTNTPVRTLFDSFTDVGTTVLLDRMGNLLVDPNLLEYDLMHYGVSADAHSLISYQYSILQWCFRAHASSFIPRFWSHSLQKLRAKYGNEDDIAKYLHKTALVTPSSKKTPKKIISKTGSVQEILATTSLEEITEKMKTQLSSTSNRTIFRTTTAYNATDAINFMVTQKLVPTSAAAIEMCRVMVVKGSIELVGGAKAFDAESKFIFPADNKSASKLALPPIFKR